MACAKSGIAAARPDQREVAARMQFAERPGKSAVERFMQYYFLNAKKVGALTGVFLAQLDEQFARDKRGWFSGFRLRGRKIGDFPVVNGKLSAPGDAAQLEAFVDGWVADAMAREHIAGTSVSVVQNGQVLAHKKYRLLRVAYSIFIVGLVASVVAFAASSLSGGLA